MWKSSPLLDHRYEINERGDLRRKATMEIKSKRKTTKGYIRYRLSIDGVKKDYFAHILVAQAFIGDRPKGLVVDHINHDKADNRVENLRYITNRENTIRGKASAQNPNKTSKYVGVRVSDNGKITAQKGFGDRMYYLGTFNTEEDASQAYESCMSVGDAPEIKPRVLTNGISYMKDKGKFRLRVVKDGVRCHAGYFNTWEEAEAARTLDKSNK
jgi:hypothetical protein